MLYYTTIATVSHQREADWTLQPGLTEYMWLALFCYAPQLSHNWISENSVWHNRIVRIWHNKTHSNSHSCLLTIPLWGCMKAQYLATTSLLLFFETLSFSSPPGVRFKFRSLWALIPFHISAPKSSLIAKCREGVNRSPFLMASSSSVGHGNL